MNKTANGSGFNPETSTPFIKRRSSISQIRKMFECHKQEMKQEMFELFEYQNKHLTGVILKLKVFTFYVSNYIIINILILYF